MKKARFGLILYVFPACIHLYGFYYQDFADSIASTPPPKIDDSSTVFAKPTPPDDLKRKNPRVYSYSPISRTRLTVPKRQFSPEPTRKTSKSL